MLYSWLISPRRTFSLRFISTLVIYWSHRGYSRNSKLKTWPFVLMVKKSKPWMYSVGCVQANILAWLFRRLLTICYDNYKYFLCTRKMVHILWYTEKQLESKHKNSCTTHGLLSQLWANVLVFTFTRQSEENEGIKWCNNDGCFWKLPWNMNICYLICLDLGLGQTFSESNICFSRSVITLLYM